MFPHGFPKRKMAYENKNRYIGRPSYWDTSLLDRNVWYLPTDADSQSAIEKY